MEAVKILAHALTMRKEDVFINLDMEVCEKSRERIHKLLAERKKGKPFAYITQCKEFYTEKLYVDERVLIPRPETEMLVEEALEFFVKKPETNNILDMGTGSGAIGLILAKKTQKNVVCVDVSIEALCVANRNRKTLGLSGRVRLLCSDLFTALGDVQFDLILANLPYVAAEEWDSLMTDVKDYEPRTALDGGCGGTAIYRRFIEGLPRHLNKKGNVVCEVGSYGQASTLRDMFREIGLDTIVKKDLSGHERILIGSWTNLL